VVYSLTQQILKFQTTPSVAFSLMSGKTLKEKTQLEYKDDDTQFMIDNLSSFPIAFWITIKDSGEKVIFDEGPWRAHPKRLFMPHSESLIPKLKKENKNDIYVKISYAPFHSQKFRKDLPVEKWTLTEEGRWKDMHSMEDRYDYSYDKRLIRK